MLGSTLYPSAMTTSCTSFWSRLFSPDCWHTGVLYSPATPTPTTPVGYDPNTGNIVDTGTSATDVANSPYTNMLSQLQSGIANINQPLTPTIDVPSLNTLLIIGGAILAISLVKGRKK